MCHVQDSRRHLFQDDEVRKYPLKAQVAPETYLTSGARSISKAGYLMGPCYFTQPVTQAAGALSLLRPVQTGTPANACMT